MASASPLRVAIVSRGGPDLGGASRMAEMSATLFQRSPSIACTHFVGELARFSFPWQRLFPAPLTDAALVDLRDNFDVLHIHDVVTLLASADISRLRSALPVVWTLRDVSPLSGGCISPFACTGFESNCASCPQVGQWPLSSDPLEPALNLRSKQSAFRDLPVIAPSDWMARMAERSSVPVKPARVIRNFVDVDVFAPRPKAACRAALGWEERDRYVLVTSLTHGNPHKGGAEALRAIALSGTGARPVIIGRRAHELAATCPELRPVPMGWLRDSASLAIVTAACDVLAYPSFADNAPNAVLESLACGTAVAAFDVGGVGELAEHGTTGLLAPVGDLDALAGHIYSLLTDEAFTQALVGAGLLRVARRHTAAVYLDAHLRFYEDVLRGNVTANEHRAQAPEPLGG